MLFRKRDQTTDTNNLDEPQKYCINILKTHQTQETTYC